MVTTVVAAALALGVTGCGHVENSAKSESASTGWVRVADAPLSPREDAFGVWTGSETLVIGGSDARPCPANADCIPPEVPPLRDGAAFDPETGTWRTIADAPVGLA